MYRDRRKKRGRLRWVVLLALIVLAAWGAWGVLYVGPAPVVEIDLERPAIGEPTRLTAGVTEPKRGLGVIELQLVQGDNAMVVDRFEATHPSPWKPWATGETQAALTGRVGRGHPDWLAEGEAIVRVVALQMTGPLRRRREVVEERAVPVLLRPPSLSVLSGPTYARQGGTGAIVFRPGETASRSGIEACGEVSRSFPLPGGAAGERFVLFGVPWNCDDESAIVLFAEDDAGNRASKRALDGFRPRPPRRDTIRLNDGFFESVVPAIESQTPQLDRSGTLLERYLRINAGLREENRALLARLSTGTEEAFLWSGAFLQLPSSARKANFAEMRTYTYEGRIVDRQTHLGLDLASVARAPVPAANSGVVRYAGFLGIYGNAVVVDHGFGLMSVNAHLSAIDVAEGQRVARGETLGRTGATGLAGGDHLHLGLFIQGTAIDPIEWLDPRWIERNVSDRLPVGASPQAPPAAEEPVARGRNTGAPRA